MKFVLNICLALSDRLLVQLAVAHLSAKHDSVPVGIALTEYYDVLDLTKTDSGKSLQKQFCELMTNWRYDEHHERIVKWAQKADVPILTTNFDKVLSDAGKCTLRRTKKGNFTDYYPWESYYGSKEISDPSREFGIWHVNGMQYYHRSIRLGLTHYMGSVTRAHKWLRKKNKRNLFSGKDVRERNDAVSWLQIVFNKPLMIFGLGLEENEVFFRWLLIERARYFKKFPERWKSAWFVHAGELNNDGKHFFLDGVGVQPIRVTNYDDIYGAATWG